LTPRPADRRDRLRPAANSESSTCFVWRSRLRARPIVIIAPVQLMRRRDVDAGRSGLTDREVGDGLSTTSPRDDAGLSTRHPSPQNSPAWITGSASSKPARAGCRRCVRAAGAARPSARTRPATPWTRCSAGSTPAICTSGRHRCDRSRLLATRMRWHTARVLLRGCCPRTCICPADLARCTGLTLPGRVARCLCSNWRSRLADWVG
jgi:hypothetical protein